MAWRELFVIPAVVNDARVREWAIVRVQRAQHRGARRDDEVRRVQPVLYFGLVALPFRGWCVAFDRLPPGIDAGVTGDERRVLPRQASVCVAVEMDQIRLQAIFEVQQPVARAFDVGPAVRHPFEFVIAFEEREVGETAGVIALRCAQ